MKDYFTILDFSMFETEIKKSRFITEVHHVKDEVEVEAILSAIRKKHFKATHVCSAYVLNTEPMRQKFYDDGEPAGTAGKPICDILHHNQLKNVLVVVIRYFGGVKLGAGGLIRAYGGCASNAVKNAQIVKKQYCDLLSVEIDYSLYGGVINLLINKDKFPISEEFLEKVTLVFNIPVEETKMFIEFMVEATNGQLKTMVLESKFVDILL